MDKKFIWIITFLFCLTTSSALINDTVFSWTLDNTNTSGTVTFDVSNQNRPATLVGGVVSGQAGKFNESFFFDGSDDWLEGNFTGYGPALSCFIWVQVNASDIGAAEGYIHKDNNYINGAFRDFWFISDIGGTTDKLQLFWWLTNGTLQNKLSDSAVDLTSFSMIGFTYNGTTGNVTFYLNSSSIGSSLNTVGTIRDTYPRINVFRTQDGAEPTRYVKGRADEINCYNRSLPQPDVLELYTTGNPYNFTTPPAAPPASDNLYISAQNAYNSSFLPAFNATVDGTTYGTTNGKLNVTAVLKNSTALHNITISKSGYLPNSYYNVSPAADFNSTITVSEVNITAFDLFTNAAITNFSATIGTKSGTTTNGTISLKVNADTYTLNASAINFYLGNSTTITTSAATSQKNNISLYKGLKVFAVNTLSGQPITSFTITLIGINNSRTELNTSSANFSFFKSTFETVNITIAASGYAPHSVLFATTNAAESNYTFSLYTTNSFNITFKNEATLVRINTTIIYLDLIGTSYANNYSTSNGTAYIDALTPETYTLRYYGSGFSPRLSTQTLTNNTYTEITLYLLPAGDNVTLFVYNEKNIPLEAASINIYRYSTASNSYIQINSIATDFEGKAVVNLQKNAEFYRFYIYYNNVLKLATSPAYVSGDELIFTINTGEPLLDNYFNDVERYTYSLIYSPTTANFRFYYDTSGEASQGCILLYTITATGAKSFLTSSCQSAATATILQASPNITDVTYYAEGIITVSGTNSTLITMLWQEKSNALKTDYGLFFTLILTLIFAMSGLYNIKAAFVLTPIAIIISSAIGLINIPLGMGLALEVVGIILAIIVSRVD